MIVAIAGGHGKIGLRLTTLLAERGDRVLGVIRNPVQADHVSTAGGEPVIADLENSGVNEVARGIELAFDLEAAVAGDGGEVGEHGSGFFGEFGEDLVHDEEAVAHADLHAGGDHAVAVLNAVVVRD